MPYVLIEQSSLKEWDYSIIIHHLDWRKEYFYIRKEQIKDIYLGIIKTGGIGNGQNYHRVV